jgi:LmbE family N-acetylglucosaminyl deacetylase
MAGSPDNNRPDSLFQAPLDEVTLRIVASIRAHRPQVVICDNRFGGYGHPDHIKLHQATVEAFSAAGDPRRYPDAGAPWQPERLYHPAFSPGILKAVVRLMPLVGRDPRRFGRNGDIDLTQMISWETPVHARIDARATYQVKMTASACHRSQGGPTGAFSRLPGFLLRRMFGYETFTRGYPDPPAQVVDDLFE